LTRLRSPDRNRPGFGRLARADALPATATGLVGLPIDRLQKPGFELKIQCDLWETSSFEIVPFNAIAHRPVKFVGKYEPLPFNPGVVHVAKYLPELARHDLLIFLKRIAGEPLIHLYYISYRKQYRKRKKLQPLKFLSEADRTSVPSLTHANTPSRESQSMPCGRLHRCKICRHLHDCATFGDQRRGKGRFIGAVEKTRTSTRLPPQAPQACASTIPPRPHRGRQRRGYSG
jgi:hypothetical protein